MKMSYLNSKSVLSAFCLAATLLAQPSNAAEADLLPQTVEDIEPTVVGFDEYDDPWEGFNRRIFTFNDVTYRYALIPVANGYTTVVPQVLRSGIGNVFDNLREPLHMLNHGAQGKFGTAARNIFRFITNTTIGILGIFDPSEHLFGVSARTTSLNATLTAYGIGSGPYLVLPLLGPGDVRSGFSGIGENLLHPAKLLVDSPDNAYIMGFDYFQNFAPSAQNYLEIADQNSDPYLYFRNLYLQGEQRDEVYSNEEE